jgi:NAD+ synthase
MDYNKIASDLQNELKYFLGDRNAVIGISGGIDSAVVAALCVNAVGKDRVIGVQMPYGDQSTDDGTILSKHLGICDKIINIKHIVQSFPIPILPSIDQNAAINRLTNGNVRARVRMTLLYAYAGSFNGMVIGTGNKTELMLGYFSKYGDGGCDVEAIGALYKTEVFELARYLGIPDSIVNKSPSAELWEGQTDEGEIGMTYEEMDGILMGMETKGIFFDRKSLVEKYGEVKVDIIAKKIRDSEHKRNMPKTLR